MQDRSEADVHGVGRPLAEGYEMESSDSKNSTEKINKYHGVPDMVLVVSWTAISYGQHRTALSAFYPAKCINVMNSIPAFPY